MEQKQNSPQPRGIKLNVWHIIGFIMLGAWLPVTTKFWAVAVFWGAYGLLCLVGYLFRLGGGSHSLGVRAAWIIHRARTVKQAKIEQEKYQEEILKAAQAENQRTGTTVKERFDKEIKQIREQEAAEKARKKRWFR